MFVLFLFLWLPLTFVVGWYGADRKIGATAALLISLIFSPLIGLICVALSERLPKKGLEQLATQSNIIDSLAKLSDLRDKGVVSEEEFQAQKTKLMEGGLKEPQIRTGGKDMVDPDYVPAPWWKFWKLYE
ncbi:MAG: SHOCT domain-containing protein [Bacteroidetes bacterium]|nr:SHOCT domain-containing protein [Bacteroidota bacterium]